MYKKIAVVAFVIMTFALYSIHQRGESTPIIINPKKSTIISPSGHTPVSPMKSISSATYKNGSYTGKSSDAIYGFIQVKATVSGGKLTSVDFLDYPQDRQNSVEINNYAMPQLQQQAIQIQSAKVDGVSGATDTSQAFIESLTDALIQAKG